MIDFEPPPQPVDGPAPVEASAAADPILPSPQRTGTRPADPARMEAMRRQAEDALLRGDDAAARALVGEMLTFEENALTPRARELAGILAERSGRIEEARAIFEAFLKDYPQSDAVPRVNMRLGALEKAPGGAPTNSRGVPADVAISDTSPERRWRQTLRGTFSQFYIRDRSSARFREITSTFGPGFVDHRINVDELLTKADFSITATNGSIIVEARAAAGYVAEFRPVQLTGSDRNKGSYALLDQMYLSLSDGDHRYRLTAGRHKEYGSGIFGRFDGISGAVRIGPDFGLRVTYGRPVWSERQTYVEDDREFYMLAADFGGRDRPWEATVYWFDQRAAGTIDRQAIGVQARYRGEDWSLEGLIDYDVAFGALNAAFLNATKVWADGTSVSLIGQQQLYPALSLTNAVIGQLDPRLETVLGQLDTDSVREIARDRTLRSRALTATLSKPLSDRWRLTVDAGLSSLSGDPGSLGIPAYLETGTEVEIGAQVHGNGIFTNGDRLLTAVRFADVRRSRSASAEISYRLPLGPDVYLAPRLRLLARDHKQNRGTATTIAPSVRAVWKVAEGVGLDAQLGAVFGDERYVNYDWRGDRREDSFIAHIGYVLRF